MEHARASGSRSRAAARGLRVLWWAPLWLAAAASAQYIRIPDLSERPAVFTQRPGEPCERCGVIRSIREIQNQRPVDVPQAFRTDPMDRGPGSTVYVGAVIALPLGEGGKPFVGGVGTPEMRQRFAESSYEIVIRLDDGGYTMVQRRDGASFSVGDRVRVQGVQLELVAP